MEHVKDCVQIPCLITGRYAHRVTYLMQSARSNVYMAFGGRQINAKSLLGILSLNLKPKDIVNVYCYNEDIGQAEEDLKYVVNVLENIGKEG